MPYVPDPTNATKPTDSGVDGKASTAAAEFRALKLYIQSTILPQLAAAALLTTVKTVDGTGSGLDADLLDGLDSTAFALVGHNHTGTYQPLDADLTAIAALAGTSGLLKKTAADTWTLDTTTYLNSTAYTAADVLAKLITVDGIGSGLDADFLDGNHASAFSLTGHNHTGTYQPLDADLTAIAALAGTSGLLKKTAADTWSLDTTAYLPTASYTAADVLAKLITVDGPSSGLDADTLDGSHASAFAGVSHNHTGTYQPLDADLTAIAALAGTSGLLKKTAADTWSLDTTAYLPTTSYTAADVLAKLLTVDGASSGLDADLLDGNQASAFAAASHNHTGTYLQPHVAGSGVVTVSAAAPAGGSNGDIWLKV